MASILEAARALGVSPDTVYRRVREGTLEAVRVGKRWDIHLKDETATLGDDTARLTDAYVNSLLDRIKSLEVELEARRREILQLHSLIQQKALPAPRVSLWARLLGKQA
jgi:excisionase family DNA binding protein